MTRLSLPAPAKVNLSLAVTGRRGDGYHELDSLVVFADVADMLTGEPAEYLEFQVEGRFAPDLAAEDDNLVLRAARLFGGGRGARLTLTKNLPVAAGLGGGSSDAAAALKLLAELWQEPLPAASATSLGADLPVCLRTAPARVSGIGEVLLPAELPQLALVLVNPGVALPTGTVFDALGEAYGEPPPCPSRFKTLSDLLGYLMVAPNALEAPARTLRPEVGEVLEALANLPGCLLPRMSGSGATCFGLFAERGEAVAAADAIAAAHPGWWVQPAGLFRQTGIA